MSFIWTKFDKLDKVLSEQISQWRLLCTKGVGMFIFRKIGPLNSLGLQLYSNLQGEYYTSLEQFVPDAEGMKGFRIEGGERKFVTLYDAANGSLTVIIGPELCEGYYYHRQLLEPMKKAPLGHLRAEQFISGGGEVKFIKTKDEPWILEFGGLSGDFGVFNPKLLFHRDTLQSMLSTESRQLKVSFSWKN